MVADCTAHHYRCARKKTYQKLGKNLPFLLRERAWSITSQPYAVGDWGLGVLYCLNPTAFRYTKGRFECGEAQVLRLFGAIVRERGRDAGSSRAGMGHVRASRLLRGRLLCSSDRRIGNASLRLVESKVACLASTRQEAAQVQREMLDYASLGHLSPSSLHRVRYFDRSTVAFNLVARRASAVRRPGKAPEGAVPGPSPGRHAATRSRRESSSSSPPTADGFGVGTPVPSPQSQSFSRSYGSVLPTSLAYIVPWAIGCSPWRPDAVMSTTGRGRHSVLRIFKGRRGRTGRRATCSALPATGPYLRLSRFQGGRAVKQKR
ncbi:hypothetical protein C4D60_Mb00t01020 [Musa balbisiana]|uniref:Uncharacterized protein n=1 Tax=Musa balbisiana TaxID=52838 RepID=A0A4S8I5K8_MUSBA|nr:hypothetical protein C4D60_Mb00t01020 [Musa balbisiana]